MGMSTFAKNRAFTLIELLVVIGVIAVLAGGIGVALLGGNSSTSLQNSQSIVSSLISTARSKAAVAQRDAAILVNAQTDSEGFLRQFYIAVRDAGGTKWLAAGDPVFLDKGMYLVPEGATFGGTVTKSGTWTDLDTTAIDSSAISPNLRNPDDSADLTSDAYRVVAIFNSRGTLTSASPGSSTIPVIRRLVVSPAQINSGAQISFDKPDAVRGLLISTYGVPTLINEAEAFKP